MTDKQWLQVRINSPEKVIWEGQADSVSSVNRDGPFDILPFHANFLTIIEKKPIKIQSEGKTEEYTFENSVIYAHKNSVYIYAKI
jgi:F-type H+-transporting ATPase subunit epsilon